jgi:hypothetical protein
MDDGDWDSLLWAIEDGRCTPFLGAGACVPTLPTGRELALELATAHGFPLDDPEDLAKVSEFVAVRRKAMYPKHWVRQRFRQIPPPEFTGSEPHAVMARLPISVYLTTNYVDFMAEALRGVMRNPRVEFCRWNETPAVRHHPVELQKAFVPRVTEPVVYHLHGHIDVPQSFVLTESDYIAFLAEIGRRKSVLPHQIDKALANASLIFLGYAFGDMDFRVILRGLVTAQDVASEGGVTVQLDTDDEASRSYFEQYFDKMDLRVYWGTASDFAAELWSRWTERRGDH